MNRQENQNYQTTSNPVFNRIHSETEGVGGYGASYKGIMLKTGISFLTLIVAAIGSLFILGLSTEVYIGLVIGSLIMASVSVFIASFSVRLAPTFTIIYSVSEGIVLGLISAMLEAIFPGIVMLAVLITLGIFGGMLVLYSTKLVVVTSRFRKVMLGLSFGIMMSMLLIGIVSIFDGGNLWMNTFGGNTDISLLLTLFLLLYGSFMLVINFDNAKMLVSSGIDKRYEWQASLGLMVSTVYIYIQVLRLLLIILSRRD